MGFQVRTACAFLGAALLLICVPGAANAAGFVSAVKVSRLGDLATVSVTFSCNVNYLSHDPSGGGDQLRIQLEPTSICNGAAPSAALTREQLRPLSADEAKLIDVDYDGESPIGPVLRLNFSDTVNFAVSPFTNASTVLISVRLDPAVAAESSDDERRVSRRVERPDGPRQRFVINLESSLRAPATADVRPLALDDPYEIFISQANVDGRSWYRLRLGYFETAEAASRALALVREQYSGAWIDRAADEKVTELKPEVELTPVPAAVAAPPDQSATSSATSPAPVISSNSDVETLMAEGKRAMTAGELSRAVQVYTKVLQLPENEHQPAAQEFLALARERNGQIAHARAEYGRFLATWPDHEAAERVQQRLAALVAQPRTTAQSAGGAGVRAKTSPWSLRTFFTQYYRRDVNQLNDQEEVISQSAVFSDVNVDARRRGQRFDFSARLSAGYRNSFLADERDDRDLRMSYAYADLADSETGLRGRLGRQSRNTGGVLGRFDGFNLAYQAKEWLRVESVVGKPVNSTYDAIDDQRTFYGLSTTIEPVDSNLDFGFFVVQQNVEDMTDRQAIGAEFRYFGEGKSLWGMADYDTAFQEFGSLFLQGSWRLPSRTTLTGVIDRRRSPFLSSSNALIGQPFLTIEELSAVMTEDEIRQLALDRAAATTTMTAGISHPVTPRLQINLNASQSTIDATPESGGIAATSGSTYRYVSTDLVASSLLKEGDVTLLRIRFSDSNSASTYSFNIDTRYPIGRHFRINPRIRVDYREMKTDLSTRWMLTPGIRLQYRSSQRFRFDLEAGKQYLTRESDVIDEDRESYFINIGYQLFF